MAKKDGKKERSDADRRVRQCERLARLMQTLHLLMGKGRWDADALAQELQCSRRTVFRLLQTLSLAGVPWYYDDKLKAYKVRPGYKFSLVEEQFPQAKQSESLPDDLSALAEQLIRDGDAFADSLQEFLVALKRATGRK